MRVKEIMVGYNLRLYKGNYTGGAYIAPPVD
jgi:hypothetical protein